MANEKFNPNGYNDTQIVNALKYGLEDHAVVAENTAGISAIRAKIALIDDLIEQIIYRGSDNQLRLDPENMTISGDLTASLRNGVLTISKGITVASPTITITGVDIPAGTWCLGVSTPSVLPMMMLTLYDDSSNVVAVSSPITGVSDSFTVDTAITGGSLEIEVDKIIVANSMDIVPYIAASALTTAFPFFRSLAEVSADGN